MRESFIKIMIEEQQGGSPSFNFLASPRRLSASMVVEKDGLRSMHNVDLRLASTSLYEELIKLGTLEPSRPLSIVEHWASTSTPTATQSDLLDALSHIIIHPLCTVKVALRFYPLLLDILVRSVERIEASELGWSNESARLLYHAVARLLHPFPTILP
jgi:hypothetical protein